jgi:putative FmdB family regulatory protein
MPIYAYQCNACGAEEEHIQRFSDPPLTTCERCGGSLEKLLSAAAFHLKGGGWYKDGYASAKPGKSDGGGDSKSTSSESKSTSSETTKKSDGGAKAAAE